MDTAYYATRFGYEKGDDNNVRALLEQMKDVSNRRAALVSTLVALRSADDPEPLVASGRVVGRIAPEPVGSNGFDVGISIDDKGQHDLRSEATGTKLLKAGESSKKFNTYGFLWTEKGFTWFLNGKPVHKVDRPVVDAPMTLGINHRCGEWERPNLVVKNLPDDVEVDWVKIWK